MYLCPQKLVKTLKLLTFLFHTLLIVLLDWVNQTLKELRFVFQKVITLSYTIKDGNLGKTYQERERMRPQEVAFAQDQHG